MIKDWDMITEETSKRNADEEAEEIDTLGQESETKAVKWVQEIEKREEKKRQDAEGKQLELIEKKRRFKKNEYYDALVHLAKKQLHDYDIPKGYEVDVLSKGDGRILFGVHKIGYKWYAKGMRVCADPHYDINCVERLVVQTMISLDELQKQFEQHRTSSGIILPVKR